MEKEKEFEDWLKESMERMQKVNDVFNTENGVNKPKSMCEPVDKGLPVEAKVQLFDKAIRPFFYYLEDKENGNSKSRKEVPATDKQKDYLKSLLKQKSNMDKFTKFVETRDDVELKGKTEDVLEELTLEQASDAIETITND